MAGNIGKLEEEGESKGNDKKMEGNKEEKVEKEEIGFKFGEEIECLKIFGTESEIKDAQNEYDKEIIG